MIWENLGLENKFFVCNYHENNTSSLIKPGWHAMISDMQTFFSLINELTNFEQQNKEA